MKNPEEMVTFTGSKGHSTNGYRANTWFNKLLFVHFRGRHSPCWYNLVWVCIERQKQVRSHTDSLASWVQLGWVLLVFLNGSDGATHNGFDLQRSSCLMILLLHSDHAGKSSKNKTPYCLTVSVHLMFLTHWNANININFIHKDQMGSKKDCSTKSEDEI